MSNKTHPEIPPDCPFFYAFEGKLKWEAGPSPAFCFDCDEGDESFKYWRPIIAAVAEVAWRKEYDKYQAIYVDFFNTYMTDVGLSDDERRQMFEAGNQRNTAHEKCSEWRAWGEVK